MNSKKVKDKYVAFLRGINVGGHHKVPMVDLQKEMEKLKFENVVTLLNSGNIIFDAASDEVENLEKTISEHLEKAFGFPMPTIIRKSETIVILLENDPFKNVKLTKDIRLYVSFLRNDIKPDFAIPWTTDDGSFKIISYSKKTIFSVLNLAITKTPKGMEALERNFGTDITTRNWNTILRIGKKLEANL